MSSRSKRWATCARGSANHDARMGLTGEINTVAVRRRQRSGDIILADDNGILALKPEQIPMLVERCEPLAQPNREASSSAVRRTLPDISSAGIALQRRSRRSAVTKSS